MKKEALPVKLNICIIANRSPLFGDLRSRGFIWPIARGLVQKGHQVTFLTSGSGQNEDVKTYEGVQLHYLRKSNSKESFPNRIKEAFAELHHKQPFHLVHSLDSSAVRIARYRKYYRVAMCYDVEAIQMSQIFSILGMAQETIGSLLSTAMAVTYKFLRTYYGGDRYLLNNADGIFVTSPQQRISLERYYLYPDASIYTVPYGIGIGDLTLREKSKDLYAKYNIPETSSVIVTISDMTEIGEMRNLLNAYQRVVIKKPNSRLVIIGNGPLRYQIEHEMLNLALGSKVIMPGAVANDELLNYIDLCDAFIDISSRSSGFEPSLLEAMAQKKLVIGSEMNPISAVIQDGQDGFLIRPADTKTLSRILYELFSKNFSTADFGENARKKVLNLFDEPKMLQEMINSYFNVLRRSGYYRKAQ